MKYKVYVVRFLKEFSDVDMDMCPTTSTETTFENIYSSRVAAIRQAQRRFAKSNVGHYTLSVQAAVRSYIISEKGMNEGKRIYNLYKKV